MNERVQEKRGSVCGWPGSGGIWVAMTLLPVYGGYALAFVAQEFDDAALSLDRDWRSIPTQRKLGR